MAENNKTVEQLKKITLAYTAGSEEGACDLVSGPQEFEFIFGAAAQGLTPFEFQLEGRSEGERFVYAVAGGSMAEDFGHLLSSMGRLPVGGGRFYFNFEIRGIAEAGQRELVQALAAAASCGCGSGCGCGQH